MRLRKVLLDGVPTLAVREGDSWVPLDGDLVPLLAGGLEAIAAARMTNVSGEITLAPLLPFQPCLMRAFATSERHWTQSARGHVRRNMPWAVPLIGAYEKVARRPFPPLAPGKLFYEQPSFYIGNHLTFVPDGAEAPWPAYTQALDFEIELAAIVVKPLRDATAEQAASAIGGFVVVNDLSARDVQWREAREGLFGPVSKTKTFASAMSAEVVTADEILPRARQLSAQVRVNGELWSATDTGDQRWSFEEMVASASVGEDVHPGELFSAGTLHDGCSLEIGRWLSPGDELELAIEGVGSVRNRIGAPR